MESNEMIGAGAGIAVLLFFILVGLCILAFSILVAWKITARTGYPGVLGLLHFVPVVNFVFLLVLAFSEWPVQKELKSLKGILGRQAASPTGPGSQQLPPAG